MKVKILILVVLCFSLTILNFGCSPEVGSKQWCEDMKEKPKKDWTANEAADFARHCIFK